MKTILHRLLLVLILMVVAVFILSWAFAAKAVKPRQFVVGEPPTGLVATPVSFGSRSGSTLHGWNAPSGGDKGVVLLLHGIRASRISMQRRAVFLQAHGYSSVLIDFQAHGESIGQAITVGYLEQHDVDAALNYVRQEYPEQPIGIIAVSMGGAATLFTSPEGVNAVVLESVYPDIHSAVFNRINNRLGGKTLLEPIAKGMTYLLLLQLEPHLGVGIDQLKPIEHIAELDAPVFVVSGAQDKFTTAAETKKLFDSAQAPKELWLVENAGHENLSKVEPEHYKRRVLDFLEEYM